MSVLVTGAAGIIGSHLVDRLLARGESVVGLDSFDSFYPRPIKEANLSRAGQYDAFTLVEGDIRDRGLVAGLPDSIDSIIHLAARAGVRPSIREPTLYADVNIVGTSVLLDFAVSRGIRPFVFASSSSVYGNNSKIPFAETDPVDHPVSPYAATKRGGELLCSAASHLHGLSCLALRFFTVYGPRQRPDLAIRKFSGMLLAGREIPRFGDGSTARDYTFIGDISEGVLSGLEWVRHADACCEIVNLGESRPVRLSDMIRVLGEAFDRTPRVKELPMEPGDVERTYADVGKAERLLNYHPDTVFEDGIREFADWYLAEGARQDGIQGPT